MVKNKKGMSAWIWVLILLIVVALGIGAYFLFAIGNGSSIIGGGSSIPQPPALPSG